MRSTLYIVGTPIGNLKDISFRAVETLKAADLIACEDTRRTKILLDEYSIKTPTTSYHKFNIKAKTKFLITRIKEGRSVALVSDAGMPAVSDPGYELVKAVADEGVKIEVIPGPCAVVSALSVSGMPSDTYLFAGFLPSAASERKEKLIELSTERTTIVIYEAPHRLIETLSEIRSVFGDREMSIARELTKKFEEVIRGRASAIIEKFKNKKPKGEFVIVVEGNTSPEKVDVLPSILLNDLIGAGMLKSTAVKIVAHRMNVSKNELYRQSVGG